METTHPVLSLRRPGETARLLGQVVRSLRMSREWTQGELSGRAGVPTATLSRFEREGKGSTEGMLRLLSALGELDRFHEALEVLLARATAPRTLDDLDRRGKARRRVRHRRKDVR